jgi:hypothetical protein
MFAESGAKVVLADIDGHLAAKEAERIVAEGGTASPATLPMRRSPRWSIAQDAIERICSAEFSDRPLVAVADPGSRAVFGVMIIWRILPRPMRIARGLGRLFLR